MIVKRLRKTIRDVIEINKFKTLIHKKFNSED